MSTNPENAQENVISTAGKVKENENYPANVRRIMDIELPVTVSFGSAQCLLSEVLMLAPGAVVELDRGADEPVILKINNKVFARGEVVEVDGYYGVQITEIDTTAERIASLGAIE